MSDVEFKKHRVFRETSDVIFYDISVEESNASDLVIHEGPAISPPDDKVGAKQFYIHYHQVDHNRVVSGERTFELVKRLEISLSYRASKSTEWCISYTYKHISSFCIWRKWLYCN